MARLPCKSDIIRTGEAAKALGLTIARIIARPEGIEIITTAAPDPARADESPEQPKRTVVL